MEKDKAKIQRITMAHVKKIDAEENIIGEIWINDFDSSPLTVKIKKWHPEIGEDLKELGRASANNIAMGLSLAAKDCDDFVERVYCYKVTDGGLSAALTRAHKKIEESTPSYKTIVFYKQLEKERKSLEADEEQERIKGFKESLEAERKLFEEVYFGGK